MLISKNLNDFLKVFPKDLQYVLKYYYPYILKVWKQPRDNLYIRKANISHTSSKRDKFRLKFWYYSSSVILERLGEEV